ncbi:MAG: PhoX family phosphatase, partial [Gammaproteobacteria bacterium]|nr:PhoX family phosphatase [Gammaproteobacteria bacterium]
VASLLPAAAAAAGEPREDGDADGRDDRSGRADRLIGFAPVAVADGSGPLPAISGDYRYSVLIPWGEPIEPGGPAYRWPPTAADQALQVGIGHDGMVYFPLDGHGRRANGRDRSRRGNDRGLLAINHEFGTNIHVLGKAMPESLDDVRVSQHAHGVSLVEITRDDRGQWHTVRSPRARRIHANTPMAFSGPVAGHALLQTPNGNAPLGTVSNCACGETPWGSYLTCEENFNGYFAASTTDRAWTATPEQRRYGLNVTGFNYGWHRFDRRFDLAEDGYRNEENRFGWVVEIDPWDATQRPVKRTALGRFKHEGATTSVGRGGRVVVYMGDDQRFDYIYRFVSAGNWKTMRRQGHSPLDRGTLYVARFDDDGSGEWLALDRDSSPVLQRHFADQAEVLTFARLAADRLGATPMDRPEWISVDPDGVVYCSLTNNDRRTVANPANPLAPNPDGHIIRWRDSDRHTGRRFRWEIFLLAEDTHGTEDTFSDPDGIYADPDGRLFIETDGDQRDGLNNQLLVADTRTGELRRLFTGVSGDEITGLTMTPDRRTLFVNSQHPGRGDPATTNFPAPTDGVTVPRDATIVITRKDGGIVGS